MSPTDFLLVSNTLYLAVPVEFLDGRPHYRIGPHLYAPVPLLRAIRDRHPHLPEPTALAPSQRALAHLLRAEGHSIPDIADAMSLPPAAARSLCQKASARARAVELYARGLNYTEIGFQLGISRQRAHQLVKSHAKANNLPDPTKARREARRAEAAQMHAQGRSYQEIAAHFRTTRQYAYTMVRDHHRENGLPLPPQRPSTTPKTP